jgi:hypothetical protein
LLKYCAPWTSAASSTIFRLCFLRSIKQVPYPPGWPYMHRHDGFVLEVIFDQICETSIFRSQDHRQHRLPRRRQAIAHDIIVRRHYDTIAFHGSYKQLQRHCSITYCDTVLCSGIFENFLQILWQRDRLMISACVDALPQVLFTTV